MCRAQFLAVQSRGRRHRGQLITLLAGVPTGGPPRVGLTVSRKVGHAVVRNRVRRRLREVVRALSDRWPGGVDTVLIAQPAAADCPFGALLAEATALVGRQRGGGRRSAAGQAASGAR